VYYFQFHVALWSDKLVCYTEREISDLLVSHFSLNLNFSDEDVFARQSRLHGTFSARRHGDGGIPAGRAEVFHVIAKLIFIVFDRPAEIPANQASPPYVIGPQMKQLAPVDFRFHRRTDSL